MSPLRIALVHPFSWPEVRRGGERYLADLSSYLADAGHQVDVVTGTGGRSRVDHRDGVVNRRSRHLEHPWLIRRGVGPIESFGIMALRQLVRRRYDIVHALTPTSALAGRLSGHRTLYTVLGQPDRAHFDDHPAERRVTAAAIRLSNEVAALSRSAAATEHEVFGRQPIVLSPGVRSDRFAAELRARSGAPRILFPADASDRRKGLDLALAAFGLVLRQHPGARLLLAGPGDHAWATAALGEDRDRVLDATDVLGVGVLEDVPRRYRESTVTLLPSSGEAFGLAVLESLACGTPVVVRAGGGPEEILDDDRVGRVAADGDPTTLADSIRDVIEIAGNPATPIRCRDHAHRWDWLDHVGPQHERVYARLARERTTA